VNERADFLDTHKSVLARTRRTKNKDCKAALKITPPVQAYGAVSCGSDEYISITWKEQLSFTKYLLTANLTRVSAVKRLGHMAIGVTKIQASGDNLLLPISANY
jgi:hypothetical protein